ncbi:MAG: NAD(P)-dependent oxidoreductase [Alphaproteobacteria bacterium]|nr:NAD(P)-dependent oxidoreductase [Alphaproteobacteria bacterium]
MAATNLKKRVIISGATGFIGQHLVPMLLRGGYEITALARDSARARSFDWFPEVDFIAHDIHGIAALTLNNASGATLIHLAWPGLPNYKSLFHLEENLPKSYAFIEHMLKQEVERVLVTGTCFEYGMQSGCLRADSPTQPANPYALAKDTLRKQLHFLQEQHPFTLQWARLFYMHGAGQNPKSVLAQLDAAIERGDTVFNMSGGEQLRDYLPVTVVAQQLAALLKKPSGIYNICSGTPISIRRLVEQRIQERGAKIEINLGYYPYPDYEPMAFWGEPSVKAEQ